MRRLATYIFGLCLCLSLSGQAAVIFDGSFVGDFDVSNWQPVVLGSASNGSVYTGGAPASVTVNGSNDVSPILPPARYGYGMTSFVIIVPTSGTVRFAWEYQTTDFDASYDIAGFVLNGSYTDLSSDSGPIVQTGVAELLVNSGDVFGFFVDPIDNTEGAAYLTISQAPMGHAPEPSTWALAGTALICLTLIRRLR